MPNHLRRHMITLPLLAVGGYAAICAFLYFRQESLIFFPQRGSMDELEGAAAAMRFEPWENAEGKRIGWKSVDGNAGEALLIFHGNGGMALNRTHFAGLSAQTAAHPRTYLLEYPGYGARTGDVSADALTAAGVEAVDSLVAVGAQRIVVVGQSLGTGVASAVVGQRGDAVDGLVLVTPFDSLTSAAHGRYPWLPVPWLLRHQFDSVKNLQNYAGPVAFVVAAEDTSVPAELGRRLYEGYAGIKRLEVVPGAHHNDTERLYADWVEVWEWLGG